MSVPQCSPSNRFPNRDGTALNRSAAGIHGSEIDRGKTQAVLVLLARHVETLFGKMARTFLRKIRVQSWQELRNRILKGIAEINADPVVHRWKKFEALATDDTRVCFSETLY